MHTNTFRNNMIIDVKILLGIIYKTLIIKKDFKN